LDTVNAEAFPDEKLTVLSKLPSSSRVEDEGSVFHQNFRKHQISNMPEDVNQPLWKLRCVNENCNFWCR
jgi:hypothetical protein